MSVVDRAEDVVTVVTAVELVTPERRLSAIQPFVVALRVLDHRTCVVHLGTPSQEMPDRATGGLGIMEEEYLPSVLAVHRPPWRYFRVKPIRVATVLRCLPPVTAGLGASG